MIAGRLGSGKSTLVTKESPESPGMCRHRWNLLLSRRFRAIAAIKALTYAAVETAAGSTVRQKVTMQQGIPTEKAKEIVKVIKDSKKKVQASIQGDSVRVSGKDRDALQEIIGLLRGREFGIDMQFTNYRSN